MSWYSVNCNSLSNNKFQLFYIPAFYFALPNSNDAPAFLLQGLGHALIPLNISLDFIQPIFRVVCGRDIAALVAVPKAAVRKNGDFLPGENKIGMTKNFIVSAPARYFIDPE